MSTNNRCSDVGFRRSNHFRCFDRYQRIRPPTIVIAISVITELDVIELATVAEPATAVPAVLSRVALDVVVGVLDVGEEIKPESPFTEPKKIPESALSNGEEIEASVDDDVEAEMS